MYRNSLTASLCSTLLLLAFLLPEEISAVGGPAQDRISRSTGQVHEVALSQQTLRYKPELRILKKKEEILREHLSELQEEREDLDRERDALKRALVQASLHRDMKKRFSLEERLSELEKSEKDIAGAREYLVSLARDRVRYEEMLIASAELTEERPHVATRMEKVQQRNLAQIVRTESPKEEFAFAWPVIPAKGISAGYLDEGYQQRFDIEHYAIDIPVSQGTEIRAPASGTVSAVQDRGYGYSTLTIKHSDDFETVLGHVNRILVSESQKVRKGDVVALSGGRPGSKGAGLLTTGPHVHFELHAYGWPIDPLYVLPSAETAIASAKESVIPAM